MDDRSALDRDDHLTHTYIVTFLHASPTHAPGRPGMRYAYGGDDDVEALSTSSCHGVKTVRDGRWPDDLAIGQSTGLSHHDDPPDVAGACGSGADDDVARIGSV